MILNGKNFTLEFDDGSGALISFQDDAGREYLSDAYPLAAVTLLDDEGSLKTFHTNGCPCKAVKTDYGARFDFLIEDTLEISAQVKVSPNDSLALFGLKVKNLTTHRLDNIDYPGVVIKNTLEQNGGDSRLFWPAMEGVEISDAGLREKTFCRSNGGVVYPPMGWGGTYPGACPMQFMSVYNGNKGMYFGCHDPMHNYKVIEWLPLGDGIRLIYKLYPGLENNDIYEYDFNIVLGSQGGSWYDSAEIYRSFIEKSGTIQLPLFLENERIPEWLKGSPIITVYPVRGTKDTGDMSENCYYPYTAALQYMDALRESLDAPVMALLMHWEGTAPWSPPYVWPPYGSLDDFNRFADEMHARNNLVGVYCSGIAWTEQSANVLDYVKTEQFEKENLGRFMQTGPDGKLNYTTVCGWPIRKGYDMCPACDWVKKTAVTEAEKIVTQSGVDYIQFFDQNLGGNSYACYSKEHGHPGTPGKWVNESMRALFKEMEAAISAAQPDKKILLGCEAAAAEPFVNDLLFNDLRYNINYLLGTPAPAYNYIFGSYVKNFMGNHNTSSSMLDLNKDTDNIYMRYAYSYGQGDVLTVVLGPNGKLHWDWGTPWDAPELAQEPLMKFIRLLNDWRKNNAREYLLSGKMVKPLPAKCADFIQALKHGGKHVYPSVTVNRYVTKDGLDGQIMTNFTNQEQCVTVAADGCRCLELVTSPFENGKKLSATNTVKLVIAPRSSVLLKIQ